MKKILTIQDISCYGQCSLTVALPILSALEVETCVLPTAVLSTHTGGFTGFTCLDLTEEMLKIEKHWLSENITFDGIYTGYMASAHQIDYVKQIITDFRKTAKYVLVDPVMADNGKLYSAFDMNFVKKMRELCEMADVIVPNLTEACFLLDKPYMETYTKRDIEETLVALSKLGPKTVLITGVKFESDELGVAIYEKENNSFSYYFQKEIPQSFHGTGDIYASCFFGNLINGASVYLAAMRAVNFTVGSIKATIQDKKEHWYGVHFEKMLKNIK